MYQENSVPLSPIYYRENLNNSYARMISTKFDYISLSRLLTAAGDIGRHTRPP